MQCAVQRNATQHSSAVLSRAVPAGTVRCGKNGSFHRASAGGKHWGPLCSDTAHRTEGLARCWRGRGVPRFPVAALPARGCRRALPGLQRRSGAGAGGQSGRPRYPPLPAARGSHQPVTLGLSAALGRGKCAVPFLIWGLTLAAAGPQSVPASAHSGRAPAATAAGCATQGAGHGSLAKPQLCPSSSFRPPKGTGNLSQGFHSQASPAERDGSCGCASLCGGG